MVVLPRELHVLTLDLHQLQVKVSDAVLTALALEGYSVQPSCHRTFSVSMVLHIIKILDQDSTFMPHDIGRSRLNW